MSGLERAAGFIYDVAATLTEFQPKPTAGRVAAAASVANIEACVDELRDLADTIDSTKASNSHELVILGSQIKDYSYELFTDIEECLPSSGPGSETDQDDATLSAAWILVDHLMDDINFLKHLATNLNGLFIRPDRQTHFSGQRTPSSISTPKAETIHYLARQLSQRHLWPRKRASDDSRGEATLNGKSSKDAEKPPSDVMLIHYTISEDRTGNDESTMSARLAALGQPARPRTRAEALDTQSAQILARKPGTLAADPMCRQPTFLGDRLGISESDASARLAALGARSERRLYTTGRT